MLEPLVPASAPSRAQASALADSQLTVGPAVFTFTTGVETLVLPMAGGFRTVQLKVCSAASPSPNAFLQTKTALFGPGVLFLVAGMVLEPLVPASTPSRVQASALADSQLTVGPAVSTLITDVETLVLLMAGGFRTVQVKVCSADSSPPNAFSHSSTALLDPAVLFPVAGMVREPPVPAFAPSRVQESAFVVDQLITGPAVFTFTTDGFGPVGVILGEFKTTSVKFSGSDPLGPSQVTPTG